MDYSFLYQMLETESPSGFEFSMQRKVMEYMEPYVDKLITHHSGNVVSVIQPDSPLKVLLAGHIDEIGLMISEVLSNGLCKVTEAGGIRANMYIGQKVNAITLDGRKVPGVCNVVKGTLEKKIHADELLIDFGVDSKEECLKLVRPGDYVIFDTTYRHLANTRFTSRALDDKIGAFVCLEALKRAKEYKTENGVYALTSVGEETTMRGSAFGGYMVSPDLALVVDVTFVTGTEEGVGCGEVRLGGGPVLCQSSIVNKKLNRLLEGTAKKYQIPVQYEIAVGRTGTDADKLYYTKDGIPCALVSIPLKNMHSPSEICDFKDVENAIELIARFICELKTNNFNPYEEEIR